MHEITLCQQALTLIEEQARLHHARKVTHVWLRVGAFSCVESSALQFCFGLVCRDTIAEDCELHLEEQQAECWCRTCCDYVRLLTHRVRRCPSHRMPAKPGVMKTNLSVLSACLKRPTA
ncbi:hydrogenase maturation nickel metallochaperone HypA [Apirhabdus apintestini]|nr:hydrogenase maturation nickel metallochaperone HypA [Enterobacteriaceae bacterium CA-0114]